MILERTSRRHLRPPRPSGPCTGSSPSAKAILRTRPARACPAIRLTPARPRSPIRSLRSAARPAWAPSLTTSSHSVLESPPARMLLYSPGTKRTRMTCVQPLGSIALAPSSRHYRDTSTTLPHISTSLHMDTTTLRQQVPLRPACIFVLFSSRIGISLLLLLRSCIAEIEDCPFRGFLYICITIFVSYLVSMGTNAGLSGLV
jgi:hypothetical protein